MTLRTRRTSLIILVLIPLAMAAPVYDGALTYFVSSRDLQTRLFSGFNSPSPKPDFIVEAQLSIAKSSFSDKSLARTFEFSISGNRSSPLYFYYLSSDHHAWESVRIAPQHASLPGIVRCTLSECANYTQLYSAADARTYTSAEWNQFGSLDAPFDWYSTTNYCVSLDAPFAFSGVDLSYDLPSGYRAGVDYYELPRDKIPTDLSQFVPHSVDQISCFRIDIAREPLGFLSLAMYATIPLFVLFYVGILTFASVKHPRDRLQIYVGALFAAFAYFLSIRQILQSIISWLDVIMILILSVWIGAEVVNMFVE